MKNTIYWNNVSEAVILLLRIFDSLHYSNQTPNDNIGKTILHNACEHLREEKF